jgi:glycosyltransferase involved in cell wall biosynthesis
MRVLAVGNRAPGSGAGGYERIFAGTVAALERAGHAVEVLTPPELPWYWRDGRWLAPNSLRRGRMERAAAEVLARRLDGVDVVSWWGLGGLPLTIVEQVELPSVGVVGDGWMVYGPQVCGRPRVDLSSPRWLFISEAVRERAPELPDTAIVSPGVDPDAFPAAGLRPWTGRLACIGRVEPRKGIAVAIEALARLPTATLTVDGPEEGGHRAELEALAERLGVAGRVRFTRTPSERVHEAYADCDALLFGVTWPEPWGLVPLEAMSVGRPVVATGTGGSAEYLRAGENALVVSPGDAAALAGAVERLEGDEALRERLVTGGRETAARFSQPAFEARVVAELEARVSRR